jgi:hypothetical protein
LGWSVTESTTTKAICWPILSALDYNDDDCGAIGGMNDRQGKIIPARKLAPMPLCPPQIPHDLARAAEVGNRRLTALAAALFVLYYFHMFTT